MYKDEDKEFEIVGEPDFISPLASTFADRIKDNSPVCYEGVRGFLISVKLEVDYSGAPSRLKFTIRPT